MAKLFLKLQSEISIIMEKLNKLLDDFMPMILMLVAVIVIGYLSVKLIMRLVKKILSKTNIDHTAITFIISFVQLTLYLLVAITALATIGINVSSLITAVGAAALTAGLALQDSLSNLASGLIILLNKPFVAGDILEFEGITGRVKSIKIFFTTIHTLDNKIVTIPNSRLTTNNVVNCTMVDKRRVDLKYTISYDDDIAKVKSLIYDIISQNPNVLKDPAPSVHVGKHLDSGVEIVVMVWADPDDYYSVYYYMQENVKLRFDENGITIPFPHIVIKNDK